MKRAVILHGRPEKFEYYLRRFTFRPNNKAHWMGWLQKQLAKNDITVYAPEIPRSYDPNWEVWCKQVEKSQIDKVTILVGHSCGGGFWLRYLSEHPKLKVGKVVLVAPWLDVQKKTTTDFFDFKLDSNLAERTAGLTVIYSKDDQLSIQLSIQKIKKELNGIKYIEFPNSGHFTFFEMKTRKFPELLKECLK